MGKQIIRSVPRVRGIPTGPRALIYFLFTIYLCIQLVIYIRSLIWPPPEPRPYNWPAEPQPLCANTLYTVQKGDTCNSICLAHQIPSHGLWEANKETMPGCAYIREGMILCLPFSCGEVHELQHLDTCSGIEKKYADILNGTEFEDLNPWLQHYQSCESLDFDPRTWGTVYCLGIQGGAFAGTKEVVNPVRLDDARATQQWAGDLEHQYARCEEEKCFHEPL